MDNIGEIEKRLFASADSLRANSNFASNEYFLPVMGLIFLRHATSRFLKVKEEIEVTLPRRGGRTRPLTKEDFSQKGAIFLHPEAQFHYFVDLPDSADRAQAIISAMEGIESDYESLRGALPKSEYQELDNDVLGQILRIFNNPGLNHANGDVFGRIYEYFLTQFAGLKAHDDGEFFTPASLVQMIVNIIEPDDGTVLDPACGSGGMFVQSAHFIERMHHNPTERVTFYGMEKNATTIRLANMNLAVHGLEGNIKKAITYYEDPHELFGKCDFVMANPPFNVDEVDAEKVKSDSRLPYGLPGVNKQGKVPNGNYLWISYFDSYLNEKGRAGFVMSSQASSAGGEEAKVRKKLIEADHVDVMMAIRSNFFYTRTVPCELWFLDKAKPSARRGKTLMIDARSVCRQVTRKIFDFTPEQQKNLSAIVWLYRGQSDRFLELVAEHLEHMVEATVTALGAINCYAAELHKTTVTYEDGNLSDDLAEHFEELNILEAAFGEHVDVVEEKAKQNSNDWKSLSCENDDLRKFAESAQPLIENSQLLIHQTNQLHERLSSFVVLLHNGRRRLPKSLDEIRNDTVEHLKLPQYYWRQARWLQERFPDAEICDVEGLVKVVDRSDLNANDWSLTPGRYVGVVPELEDDDFDFKKTIRDIQHELKTLDVEASKRAAKIARNLEELYQ
ncbi:MAG: N-6 DNA methylase [Candidatus Poribacteria bacterium]|nr:N-6 DNA methylase [Candidatus Poribacteria bacterium]